MASMQSLKKSCKIEEAIVAGKIISPEKKGSFNWK